MSPRCVRNFWIELDVDGKKQRIATGPKTAGGGFSMTIKMRKDGQVVDGMEIEGYALAGGDIVLKATNAFKAQISRRTKR